MWIIFFNDTPHFWLIGGESYKVGKKDCHVIIHDDRSISRTHLTISVGLQPLPSPPEGGGGAADLSTPQPITLLDSSTYGTAIVAGEEETDDAETHDDAPVHGRAGRTAAPALETGILGLCYVPGAAAASRRLHSDSASGQPDQQPALRLVKEVPYSVPVHRPTWRQFTVRLGHHGAALRLVWVDVAVLCEDVHVEVQTKLLHALRCCGVRHEVVPGADTHEVAATPRHSGGWQEPARSCSGVGAPVRRRSAVSLLGGSGPSLSQRTTVSGTPSPTPLAAAAAAAVGAVRGGDATAAAAATRCYDSVSFLVTSAVQPSTAVVAMLCRAVPIVTPAFFVSVRDRASPQVPLPDPSHFLPPLSPWWRDLLAHVLPPTHETAGRDAALCASATPEVAEKDAVTASHLRCFSPQPERRRLFAGLTFVVLQRPLYEEVLSYLDSTGAEVVWGDCGLQKLSAVPWAGPTSTAAPSTAVGDARVALEALQTFFARHQRHVLLFNEAEPLLPWPGCVAMVQHGLSLASVEYGAVIEAVLTMRPAPSLLQPTYPPAAQLPQTISEVAARVAAASGEDGGGGEEADELTQDAAAEPEGRRTDPRPLFAADDGGGARGRDSGDGASNSRVHRRPRHEDGDGWVSFAASGAAAARAVGGAATSGAAVRVAEVRVGPHALPPYPCFGEGRAALTGRSAIGEARVFVKQSLPPPEPLVELEEHRARRQLAASMLTSNVLAVDADNVVPEQVVMGSGEVGGRMADAASSAFNAFDTAVHHAANKRRGTVARRGGRGGVGRAPRGAAAQTTALPVEVVAEETPARAPERAGASTAPTDAAAFHIFDIDGIF
ncbi:hypothetical protein NESM_000757700 [Novymonas esmeraldas]|uniref:FHA domain-containing protein n=1 Tax=Novymonas esmeraldas TaxID=1808958 RepID=A0AAW0EVA7_9TRYP